MTDLVKNCPSEFKEYYVQMQAAKRSQVPVPSQVSKQSASRLLSEFCEEVDAVTCSAVLLCHICLLSVFY